MGLATLTGAAVTVAEMNSVATEVADRTDGLALTAARALRDGQGSDELANHAVQALSQVKGGVGGSGNAEVEIISTSTGEVYATMSREVRVMLGGLLGMETVRVERSARAIASEGEPVCLHILSENQPEAFSRRGASTLEAANCVAQVNSGSREALDSRGAAGGVRTVRTRVHGSGQRVRGFTPVPEFETPVIPDPYARIVEWPDSPSCRFDAGRIRRLVVTFAPGVICGDLNLQRGADIVLSPGVHVFTGSLLMGAGASLRAEGATLVFVGENSRIDISSQSEARFVAPTEGPWKGIALAVKPQPVELTSSIQGGGGVDLTGVLYMPTQRLHLTGGGRLAEQTDHLRMLIVNRLQLNGNGRVWLNGTGSPTHVAGGVRLTE